MSIRKINITKTTNSRINNINFEDLGFGQVFSDHMFVVDYIDGEWGQPEIVPFGNISIAPSLSTLHYSQTIFEGLKAFKFTNGEVAIFRPDKHACRLNVSAERLCMPTFPEDLFIEGVNELLKLDKGWVPNGQGTSL